MHHKYVQCRAVLWKELCLSVVVDGGMDGERGGGGGVATLSPRGRSVAKCQVDGVTREGVVGALCHCPSGRFLAGEGDQGLAAALAAEVIQHEDGV